MTSLQLLQVVTTNLHVATILLQTSSEGSGISITGLGLLLVLLSLSDLLLFNWSRGRTTEHTGDTSTQSVTDSRTNGYTSSGGGHVGEKARALLGGLWVSHRWWVVRLSWGWSSCGVSRSALRSNWSGSSLSSHVCVMCFVNECGVFLGATWLFIY